MKSNANHAFFYFLLFWHLGKPRRPPRHPVIPSAAMDASGSVFTSSPWALGISILHRPYGSLFSGAMVARYPER